MRTGIATITLSVLVLVASAHAAIATHVALAANQADPGGTVEMCAALSGNSKAVGMMLDFQWDDRCVFPILGASGNPQCSANPGTGKSVLTSFLSRRTRVMIVALSDMSPIPNGPLFCCGFEVLRVPPGATCSFAFTAVTGSDKNGQESPIAAQGAVLSIRKSDDSESAPTGGGTAPAPAGAGITIPGAEQGGTRAAPLATPIGNQPKPTAALRPTDGRPALAPLSQPTAAPIEPAGPGAEALPNADAAGQQPTGEELTPTRGTTAATPRATATASTPTRGNDATRTAAIATQTRTSVATPSPGTPTAVK